MANPEHVEIVKQGAEAIRAWRAKNPDLPLDLANAKLEGALLQVADLSNADLRSADLSAANLHGSFLLRANLRGANLRWAKLTNCVLHATNLEYANLLGANLSAAHLMNANLKGAFLVGAYLSASTVAAPTSGPEKGYGTVVNTSTLSGVCLDGAVIGFTTFADVDLSEVRGLDSVRHDGPSVIGVETLYRSHGQRA